MEPSKPFIKTAFSVVGAILLGLGLLSFQHHTRLRIEQRQNAVLSETGLLKEQMKSAYTKRGAVLRTWMKGVPTSLKSGTEPLLVENEKIPLRDQNDFDRYEWLQDRLGRIVVDLLRDKKAAKKKPSVWDAVESDSATARAKYSVRVISVNQQEILPKRIPTFKSDEALAVETK
jgi:hypothetical protein